MAAIAIARDDQRFARPFLKYTGGKGKLVAQLLAHAPSKFSRYFEPFVGGGALFFALQPKRATLGDANAELIKTYRAIAHDVDGVIAELKAHEDLHAKLRDNHYYAQREAWNEIRDGMSAIQHAGVMIYLNKTCFNGLYRVNRAGKFNVPVGDYAAPMICDDATLRAASRALAGVELVAGDFRVACEGMGAGDFAYLDPPYDGTFASYTPEKFSGDVQKQLADAAHALVGRGGKVMISNNDTANVRELYKGFRVHVVQRPGTMSSKGDGRQKVNELILCGGY